MSQATKAEKREHKKRRFEKYGKHAFKAYVIYHIIKGIITTTFIWIPLLLAYLSTK